MTVIPATAETETETETVGVPGPSPHEASGPPVVGDVASFPSHAELARTLVGSGGVATLSTLSASGHPYASIAPISARRGGLTLICVSELAEHTQNLRRDPRASLLVEQPAERDVDPLSLARVTFVGSFVPHDVTDTEVGAHLEAHPFARHYVDFPDFSWWRFEVLNLRYVGGFGVMGWSSSDEYAVAVADPVIPSAAPMIEHLDADHADAGAAIVKHLGGVPDATSVRVTAIDRYGMTFDAFAEPGGSLLAISRVAFPEPLSSPDQVRAASVDLVRRAQSAS